jgi:poly(3-hydroxybutyrate) depolymerase
VFDSWYENPPDLPGRWYLQAICELFKENRLGLGRRLNLELIACPLYLLAGESGDITTREQVFAAENLVGTPKGRIEKEAGPPADTSVSSWARARSRRRGRRSRGG